MKTARITKKNRLYQKITLFLVFLCRLNYQEAISGDKLSEYQYRLINEAF